MMLSLLESQKEKIDQINNQLAEEWKVVRPFLDKLIDAYHGVFCYYDHRHQAYRDLTIKLDTDEPDYDEDIPQFFEEIVSYCFIDIWDTESCDKKYFDNLHGETNQLLEIEVYVVYREYSGNEKIYIPIQYVSIDGVKKLEDMINRRQKEVDDFKEKQQKEKKKKSLERKHKQLEKLKKELGE